MNNEIKQGDKVKVSEDAPKLIFGGCDMSQIECSVCGVDKDVAVISITNDERTKMKAWIVPCKYLIKVDAEAKEAKFKLGDWVKIGETPNPRLNGRVGTISQIDKEGYEISFNDGFFTVVSEEDLTLADEPTEQTETEGERVVTPYGYGVVGKDIEGRIAVVLENGGFCGIDKAIKIIADKTDFDWDAYTADLAKELAIAYGKRGKSPLDAVAAAKEITKRLKQK